MASSLRLAFTIIYYLDSKCTEYHQGGEDNSTYHIAIEVPEAHDATQPNVSIFPAKCSTTTSGVYNAYINSDPGNIHTLEVPGDLDLTYYATEDYVSLRADTSCLLVNDSAIWQPDDPDTAEPLTGAFYLKSVIPSPVGSYTGRCVLSSAPKKSPTRAPTSATSITTPTNYQPRTIDGYALFITVAVIFGGIGAGMLGFLLYSYAINMTSRQPHRRPQSRF